MNKHFFSIYQTDHPYPLNKISQIFMWNILDENLNVISIKEGFLHRYDFQRQKRDNRFVRGQVNTFGDVEQSKTFPMLLLLYAAKRSDVEQHIFLLRRVGSFSCKHNESFSSAGYKRVHLAFHSVRRKVNEK